MTIRQIFMCSVCKKNHTLKFPDDFANNRPKYPFSYVYLHAYEGDDDNIEAMGKTVLTTLFIDANCKIRGMEAILQDQDIEIMSKADALKMVTILTNQITELQIAYNDLVDKYDKLKKECGK